MDLLLHLDRGVLRLSFPSLFYQVLNSTPDAMRVGCNLLLWSTPCFTVFAVDKYTFSYLLCQCRKAWKGEDITQTQTHTYNVHKISMALLLLWFILSSSLFDILVEPLFLQLVGWLGRMMVKRREGERVHGTSSTIPTQSSTIPISWEAPPVTRLAWLLQLLS